MTSNNIIQLIFEIKFKGDVSGELPIYNYNYNYLNKHSNQNGNIYIPNNINLAKVIFKDNKYKNDKEKKKEYEDKKKKLFNSKEEINNLIEAIDNDSKLYNDTFNKNPSNSDISKNISNNTKFVLDLFFSKNNYFYLADKQFCIKTFSKDLSFNPTEIISKNNILKFKDCSSNITPNESCTKENLVNAFIEDFKKKKLDFYNKVNPSDISKNKVKANEETIKEIQGDLDSRIEKFANNIIENSKRTKKDYLRAGIKYIYKDKGDIKNRGIYLDIKHKVLENIKIELELTDFIKEEKRKKKKIYIERGDCKTKKKYIISLWNKMTKKKNNSNIDSNKKKKIWNYNFKDNKFL